LLPIVYGDVSFDEKLGGTIASTEEQFQYLARELKPQQILLAGLEPGIWRDYPNCSELVPLLKKNNLSGFKESITGSASVDVTGGMASKVQIMFEIIENDPSVTARIFSGKESGSLLKALHGENIGTRLTA
jgi:isopentenyl phosphate kinase